ncbi:MAG: AsmA family protein [Deltaproteobacteria bacterium]|nr:AsmA family protein [Deltaproteobacteria bacterium]
MAKYRKIALFAAGGLIALLLLTVVALLLFVDGNAHKPRLEATASDALGMEVRIGGRLGIGLFPGFHVKLEDVSIRNRGADVASAKSTILGIALLPLLHKEVRIVKIKMMRPRISIEQDRDGKFNFETPEEEAGKKTAGEADGTRFSLKVTKISLSDGVLFYADKKTGEELEAGDFHLDVSRLRFTGGKKSDLLKNLSFSAEFACKQFRKGSLAVSNLKLRIEGKDGVLDLHPVTMLLFGGQGSGSIRADFSGSVPQYHVRYSLSGFRIEEFLTSLSPKKAAEGSMDLTATLSMRGKTASEMKQTADGEVSLRGENLTLDGVDLDRTFSRYEASQSFNLVDVGAFFFAGPFGLLITRGYTFTGLFHGPGGSSRIRVLVSDWKVERGVARAQDVAMATNENRIALTGSLDFTNERFDDVTVAVVDGKGCATVRQRIRGPFRKPEVEKVSFLQSAAGPVLKLIEQAKDLFGGKCEVFYAGSVAPPK